MARIYWTKNALAELDALLQFIAEEDAQTAVDVARRIDSAVAQLASFPECAPLYLPPLRRLVVQGLPYSCFYEYEDESVRVLLVRHDRQKPVQ